MTHFNALRTLKNLLAVSISACLLLTAASASAQNTPGVLRVSAIPDEAPTELQRKFKPLGEYLAKATGLKDVTLTLPVGLFTCITGVSGSGKSTLINDTLFPLAQRESAVWPARRQRHCGVPGICAHRIS